MGRTRKNQTATKEQNKAQPVKSNQDKNSIKLNNKKEAQKKKLVSLSSFVEKTSFPSNGKYTHYDVCVLMKDHFEHREFESLELAEKCAIKMSKVPWSVSVHRCEFEANNGHRKEIKSELISMYIFGEKCE